MNSTLTDVELRILGSLVEKEATTPEYYPLSLNALLAACNQTSNREPVMRLSEGEAEHAIISLRRGGWLRQIQPVGSRVTRFEHRLVEELKLEQPQVALLGVLMLRGPQTPGELHARSARLAAFADLAELEAVLGTLLERDPEPLVTRLARRPGQKEVRYAQLLGGAPAQADAPDTPLAPAPAGANERPAIEDERIAALERRVEALAAEVAALREQLAGWPGHGQ